MHRAHAHTHTLREKKYICRIIMKVCKCVGYACACLCVCVESTAAVSAAAWAANSFFVLPLSLLSPPLLLLLCLRLTFSMLMICKHKHKAQKSKCKRDREREWASTHRKYAPYKTDNKRAWGKRNTHTHVEGRHRCDRKQQQRRNQQNFARDLRQWKMEERKREWGGERNCAAGKLRLVCVCVLFFAIKTRRI